MKFRILVISDLHCHQLNKFPEEEIRGVLSKKKESYILTDEAVPILQNPYLSFIDLQRKLAEKYMAINCDILINLGDFANRSCPEGMKMAWKITEHISSLVEATAIISTIGNHDVDSRHLFSADSFKFVKEFDIDIFPTPYVDKNNEFWDKGFTFLEFSDFRVAIINTVHNHTNKFDAEHGLISDESLNLMEEYLEFANDSKLGIAICHHSPMAHSRVGSKNEDLMFNGDQLIELLDRYNFELIMHGHKHDPMIRYGGGSGDSSIVFSAGSFSAIKDILLPGGLNTFHIITLEVNSESRSTGTIETWFFVPTKGWKKQMPNPYFQSKIGFGRSVDIKRTVEDIYNWFSSQAPRKQLLYLSEFLPHFRDLEYLIPQDLERLIIELKKRDIVVSSGEINEESKIEIKSL